MSPSKDTRSQIYSGLIANSARPMAREDFECEACGKEYWSCECFGLPPYAGADPALYDRETSNGR
jgi:hypothetical protein